MKLFTVSILLLISTLTLYGLDTKHKATIYKTDSTIIDAEEILVNFGKKWNVSVIIGNQRIKSNLEIDQIKSLEIFKWDNEDEWWIEGKVILRNEPQSDNNNTMNSMPNDAVQVSDNAVQVSDDAIQVSGDAVQVSDVADINPNANANNANANNPNTNNAMNNNNVVEYMILADPDSLFQRNDQYLVYRKSDPINGEVIKNRVWSKHIQWIDFGEDSGAYKEDSLGNKFNSDYSYSPYTGEKL